MFLERATRSAVLYGAGRIARLSPSSAVNFSWRADFQLHAIEVTEEQRPLITEPLDLSYVGTLVDETLLYALDRIPGVDRDGEVMKLIRTDPPEQPEPVGAAAGAGEPSSEE